MFQTLDDAIALAEFAHRHQKDKAGFAYVEHPKRVLASVQAMGAAPYVQIAAVLHDVCEDTPFTAGMLESIGFSPAATQLVHVLSRSYYKQPPFIAPTTDEYYAKIKHFPEAVMIKKADIADNTLPWRLSYLPEETQERLRAKYAHALEAIS